MAIGLVIILSALLQIILLSIIGRGYWRYTQLRKHGVKILGEITDYDIQSTSKGQKIYFPIIKFRTYLGQIIHKKASYGLDERKYIEKGTNVEIVYLENDPERFMLDSHNPTLGFVLMFPIFIGGFILIVYLLTLKNPEWMQDFLNAFK